MSRAEGIDHHIRSLRRYAMALVGNLSDADDLVQESLKRVLVHVDGRGEIDNLRAYLFRTLRNVRLDQLKSAGVRGREVSVEDGEMTFPSPPRQDAHLECRDLGRGLAELSEDQRQVVLMICLEGLSHEEVAKIMSVSVATVGTRLHRGREALRRYLAGTDAASRHGRGGIDRSEAGNDR